MPSAISWSVASQNSNNSAASQPASKRQPEITLPSSLSQPSSYGCDKCPHHLERITDLSQTSRHVRKVPTTEVPLQSTISSARPSSAPLRVRPTCPFKALSPRRRTGLIRYWHGRIASQA